MFVTHKSFRSTPVLGVLAVAILTAVLATLLLGAGPARAATAKARTCSLTGKWGSLGPTYVEALSVKGPTCGTGLTVIKDYNACRVKSGGLAGHCRSRVAGYSCSEKRTASSIQFIAKVNCTKSRDTVAFTYSEDT